MADEWIALTQDGGLFKKIITAGIDDPEDQHPPNGADVTVHYVGTLTDGTKFDSSRDRNQPFNFKIGQGQVIKGWDVGVASMKRNEKAILKIRADYGYGASGSPPTIPPNAELIFEVELLDWNSWENCGPRKNSSSIKKKVIKQAPEQSFAYAKDGASVKVSFTVENLDSATAKQGTTVDSKSNVDAFIGEDTLAITLEKCIRTMNKGEKAKFKVAPNTYDNAGWQLWTVELHDFKEFDANRLSAKERLDFSDKKRTLGNTNFKASKFDLARKKYKKALAVVDDEEAFEKESADVQSAASKARVSCNLNIAACQLKLNSFSDVVTSASNALKDDEKNVKALFRRAQAQRNLEQFEEARKDLLKALEIEPGNKEVRAEYDLVNTTVQKQKQKQKKLYAKMFEGLGGDEQAPASTPAPAAAEEAK